MSFDGVRVVNRPADFPEEFLNSKRYLLVLSLLPAKGVGVVAPGPSGAFKLKAEKDGLESMSTQPRSALKVELDGRLGNSLRQLKAAAQKRKNFSQD